MIKFNFYILILLCLLPIHLWGQSAEVRQYIQRGNEYMQSEDFSSAIEQYRCALELAPDNTNLQHLLVIAYQKAESYDEALDLANFILEKNPKDAEINALIGWLYINSSSPKYEKAIYHLKLALEYNVKDELEVKKTLADLLLMRSRYDEAKVLLEEIANEYPRDEWTHSQLGWLLQQPEYQDYIGSIEEYQKALFLTPDKKEYYKAIGYAYEKLGKFQEAKIAYQNAIDDRLELDNWTKHRLKNTSTIGYEIKYTQYLINAAHNPLIVLDYWMALARNYPPYSYIELVDVQPAWEKIYKDERDNIIAQFHFENVMPQDTLQITFTYRLQMSPYEFPKDNALIGYYDPTSPEYNAYISSEPLIESDNIDMIAKAEALTNRVNSVYDNAHHIYDFVSTYLIYEISAEEKKGALYALNNGSKKGSNCDCTEYSLLFVALCRAIGIPARPIYGYLKQENKIPPWQEAHAWAEFMTPSGKWITVDPTSGIDFPERYFAKANNTQLAMCEPSPLLEGDRSITYRFTGKSIPYIETNSNLQVNEIPLWEISSSENLIPIVNTLEYLDELPSLTKGIRSLTIKAFVQFGLVLIIGCAFLIWLHYKYRYKSKKAF